MKTENEIDFLRTYKDFIYFFNMLERNLGSSLRFCARTTGHKTPEKWHTANFEKKIKKFMSLAKSNDLGAEFEDWHTKVQKCRHLRNIIAHGEWLWREWLEKPILYHAPDFPNGEGSFTTQEFMEKLNFLKEVLESFQELRTPLEQAERNASDKLNS